MANNLQTIENNSVSVDYRQAELQINGLDKLKKRVAEVAKLYANRVYEEGDEKALKADRSELKALHDGLDDARKNIKRQYNKPLKDFENEIKSLTGQIDEPLENIRTALRNIEDKKRDRNKQIVMDYIKKEGEVYEVEPEEVEFKDAWKNASGFTDKLNMKKRLKEDVLVEIQNVAMAKKKAFEDEQVLIKYCKDKSVDPEGWIDQLQYQPLSEVMTKIAKITEKKPDPNPEPVEEKRPEPKAPDRSDEEQIEVRTIELKGQKKFIETVIMYAKAHGIEVTEKATYDDLPW